MSERRGRPPQQPRPDWTPAPPAEWGEPGDAWARRGCFDGPGRFALGLLLVCVAVVAILAAGWVRSDRAVARCVDHPAAAECLPPRP